MNRSQKKKVVEAFRLLRLRAEEGEKLARDLLTQDIGATNGDRIIAIMAVKAYAENTARAATTLAVALDEHLGAGAILDQVKYPRAKTLSSSHRTPRSPTPFTHPSRPK